ncbi:leucine-rich repeat protein, putative, partial [Bodo saltans]
YAFDPTKKHVSRDLEAEHEAQMSPAKRERLRWLRMNPAEREAHRIHMLLSCGKAYQGRLVNLSNIFFFHRASVHNNTSTTAAPTTTSHHTNAAGKGGSKGEKGGNQQQASVTINELMPWERHKSPIWQLKYCFCDEDAEEIIQVQKKFVVVESGGQKYAFDPTKKHVSRDLEAEHEAQMSPAKRERLRWLRMNPAEREAHRIHMLLSCGKAYQGRLVNLSNNLFRSVDVMLTNTLAVLLRQNVTRLDLSFNKIETLDWNFLHVNIQEVEERKKRTMADAEAHEEEQMRHATLSHGGLLSDAQTQKQRDAFLVLRRRAVQDLVEVTAPHKLFYHLQSLYLHGNPLRDISELWKLEPLRLSLTYLTFHGSHHVDVQAKDPKNRAKLLATFPKLVQVNFTTLGDEEM